MTMYFQAVDLKESGQVVGTLQVGRYSSNNSPTVNKAR